MTVTPDDIAVALGRSPSSLTDAEEAQWQSFIDDALWLIGKRAAEHNVIPADPDVDYVVKHAVLAHLANPDDATQVTVSVDDGSTSRTYKSGQGRVTIFDEWWDLLGLGGVDGAYTIMAGQVRPYSYRRLIPSLRATWPWSDN